MLRPPRYPAGYRIARISYTIELRIHTRVSHTMAVFGRLDVLFPDGHTESHRLEGDFVTVGRAGGNAIRLDDDAVAASHFQIEAKADAVRITDLGSASGTFLSGQRLQADRPRRLRAVEDIRVGALRLAYYQRSDSPTVAMPALGEHTQPSGVDFRASLERGDYSVFPASSVTVSLEVTNRSRGEAKYRVKTSGLPDDWVKPASVAFWLPANEATQLQFLIKPARRSDMPPGDYPLVLTVTRQGDVDHVLRLVATIKLGGFGGLSLNLAPDLCEDGQPFKLYLLNQGNEPLQLALAIRDPQARLAAKLAQDQVELPAGGRRRVSAVVRARRRALIGKPVEVPFALIARSQDPSAFSVAAPARVRVQPRWSYRSAAMVAVAIITILLSAAALLIQTPEPEIMSMELSHAQVARGTPVQLEWEAANAQRFVIEVDRAQVADLPNSADAFALDTSDYADPVEIALIALQDDKKVISTRRLDIYEPVVIADFSASKSAMLRRVTESLVVRWEVTGAVALDITRPLGFETIRESAATAARGEIELRGAPDEDVVIILAAEDEIGTVVERSITIAVKAPECIPLHDTLLYAGPGKGFQQIRLAVENVPVLARGRVKDGTWLQVELASGRSGWGIRSSFECRGFDISALAVIDNAPQLSTATNSPTSAAAPTARPNADTAADIDS